MRNKEMKYSSHLILFLKYLAIDVKFLFWLVFLSIFGILESILLPAINEFIVGILLPGFEIEPLLWIILLLGFLKLSTSIANLVKQIYINSRKFHILEKIRTDVFKNYINMNYNLFSIEQKSEIMIKSIKHADNLAGFYVDNFLNIIEKTFSIVVILPFMFFSLPVPAFVCLVAVVLILIIIEIIKLPYNKLVYDSKNAESDVVKKLFEVFESKDKQKDNELSKKFISAVEFSDKKNTKLNLVFNLFDFVSYAIQIISYIIILCLVFKLFTSGGIEISNYVQFYTFQIEFWILFASVVKYNKSLCEFEVSAKILSDSLKFNKKSNNKEILFIKSEK